MPDSSEELELLDFQEVEDRRVPEGYAKMLVSMDLSVLSCAQHFLGATTRHTFDMMRKNHGPLF